MLSSYGREYLLPYLVFTISLDSSMVTFLSAFILMCFTVSDVDVRILVGTACLAIAVLVFWCITASWDSKQATTVGIRCSPKLTWNQGLAKITPGTVCACFWENQNSQLVEDQALCAFRWDGCWCMTEKWLCFCKHKFNLCVNSCICCENLYAWCDISTDEGPWTEDDIINLRFVSKLDDVPPGNYFLH